MLPTYYYYQSMVNKMLVVLVKGAQWAGADEKDVQEKDVQEKEAQKEAMDQQAGGAPTTNVQEKETAPTEKEAMNPIHEAWNIVKALMIATGDVGEEAKIEQERCCLALQKIYEQDDVQKVSIEKGCGSSASLEQQAQQAEIIIEEPVKKRGGWWTKWVEEKEDKKREETKEEMEKAMEKAMDKEPLDTHIRQYQLYFKAAAAAPEPAQQCAQAAAPEPAQQSAAVEHNIVQSLELQTKTCKEMMDMVVALQAKVAKMEEAQTKNNEESNNEESSYKQWMEELSNKALVLKSRANQLQLIVKLKQHFPGLRNKTNQEVMAQLAVMQARAKARWAQSNVQAHKNVEVIEDDMQDDDDVQLIGMERVQLEQVDKGKGKGKAKKRKLEVEMDDVEDSYSDVEGSDGSYSDVEGSDGDWETIKCY